MDKNSVISSNYKIYVTGIIGMLGYGIFKRLKEKAEITGVDLWDIDVPGLSYKKISLYDIEEIEKDIAETKPNILIHTAALVNVDECEDNPEDAKKLNTEVTRRLADICNRYEIKMVYVSTDAVFDGNDPKLYTEEDNAVPINVYGLTKLEGETAVLQYPRNLVFRTNIYGINIQEKQSFGEWIYFSLKENKTLNMFTDIDFSPIEVSELAEIIYLACQKDLHGLYHACGTGSITKYEFAIKLKEVFKIESGIIQKTISDNAQLKANRSKHMGMSNKKLCRDLQIHISTPEESIKRFYLLWREEKDGN